MVSNVAIPVAQSLQLNPNFLYALGTLLNAAFSAANPVQMSVNMVKTEPKTEPKIENFQENEIILIDSSDDENDEENEFDTKATFSFLNNQHYCPQICKLKNTILINL